MKISRLIILSSLCLSCWRTEGSNTNKSDNYDFSPYFYYTTSATNGLKLGVYHRKPHWPTNSTEEPICLSFSLPGEVKVVYVPKDEYLGRFTLYDTNNHALPKTVLGEKFKLTTDLQWNRKYVRGRGQPEPFEAFDRWGHPVELPSPSKLFEIEKPGHYRLVLEVQVFLKTGRNKDLVCFPPLEIPVIQPEKSVPVSGGQTNLQKSR